MGVKYHFKVPGDPVAKGRPRATTIGGHARLYTPAKTVSFERRVREAAEAAGVAVLDGPVHLTVLAVWAWPKSKHRKRKPRGWEYRSGGPDLDNIAKAVADALNSVAYFDDRQIAKLSCGKYRAAQGLASYTYVSIIQIPEEVEKPI